MTLSISFKSSFKESNLSTFGIINISEVTIPLISTMATSGTCSIRFLITWLANLVKSTNS